MKSENEFVFLSKFCQFRISKNHIENLSHRWDGEDFILNSTVAFAEWRSFGHFGGLLMAEQSILSLFSSQAALTLFWRIVDVRLGSEYGFQPMITTNQMLCRLRMCSGLLCLISQLSVRKYDHLYDGLSVVWPCMSMIMWATSSTMFSPDFVDSVDDSGPSPIGNAVLWRSVFSSSDLPATVWLANQARAIGNGRRWWPQRLVNHKWLFSIIFQVYFNQLYL
jgi:hypothetical protein